MIIIYKINIYLILNVFITLLYNCKCYKLCKSMDNIPSMKVKYFVRDCTMKYRELQTTNNLTLSKIYDLMMHNRNVIWEYSG